MSGDSCKKREHSFLLPLHSMLNNRNELHWYPMYVSYRRELSVKKALDEKEIKNYVPMHQVIERKERRIVKKTEPAIHNLIFVYSSINVLTELKMFNASCAPMQYMTFKTQNTNQPSVIITVDPAKMEQFMKAMEVNDEKNRRTVVPYEDALFGKEGRRVRFIKGDFEGIEGTIKRVNKNRSVIITLKYVGVLVITIDHATDIEFLD